MRSSIDRLPPNSSEAEQGVVGSILIAPEQAMPACVERLKGGSGVFYDLRHRELYDCLAEMYDERVPIDILTVNQRLKDSGKLEAVGGTPYLVELTEKVPSAWNVESYLDIVLEKSVLRRLIQTCTEVIGRAYENNGDETDGLMDLAEQEILKIRQEQMKPSVATTKELVKRALATIEAMHQNAGVLRGLPTGFPDLDKMTGGFNAGDYIIIAGRPSAGKTSLAMGIAEHVAIDHQTPVGIFSLEMTSDSLILRMVCSRARVNLRNIHDGFLAEKDFPKITGAAGKIMAAPLYIDDSSGLSIMQLRARARQMVHQFKIKALVIDYLQLLHSTNRKADSRQQEIADISCGLKALAKELQIPLIALSQLNREVEKREKGRPRLSDLRESGAIEQDADFVGLLYRASEDGEEEDYASEAIGVNLLVAKQRNGPRGEINLTFLRGITRFESAAKVSAEDVPDTQANLPYKG